MKSSKAMSRANSRRNQYHETFYASHFPIVAKRKDRNVKRSSHGKFVTVAALVAHQAEHSRPVYPVRQRPFHVSNNWLTRDKFRDGFTRDYVGA